MSYQILNEKLIDGLVESWKPLIDVKGLDRVTSESKRRATAVVLENTKREIENTYGCNLQALTEAAFTTSVDSTVRNGLGNAINARQQNWQQGDMRIPLAIMPLARRMFTQLIAHEIVGVQAMTSPTGYASAMRYVYKDKKDEEFVAENEEVIFGRFDPAYSGTMDYSGDPKQVGFDESSDTATEAREILEGFGLKSVVKTTKDGAKVVKFLKASGYDVSTGENLSFNPGEGETPIAKLGVHLEKVLVEAKTRKVGTSISMEAAEDALTSLGLDLAEEMVSMLARDIKNSMDRELLQEIMLACVGTKEKAANCLSTWDPTVADGLNQLDRLQTLYTHILLKSKKILTRTKQAPANWLVASAPVTALIERINAWKIADSAVDVDGVGAIAYAGTLRSGAIKVYNDALNETPYILLGWKGNSVTETGVVYCPYVPCQILSASDVDKFGSRLMCRARYAIVNSLFGSDFYYQAINIKNLSENSAIVSGTDGAKVFATI